MKTLPLSAFALMACMLPGCLVDSTAETDEDLDLPGEASSEPADSMSPESAGSLDTRIATLEVPGGKVIFVDEGATIPGDGIAFWEIGNVDLSSLLDDQDASALEVFLALAPEGTPVPPRLLEHHAQVALRSARVSATPRHLSVPLASPAISHFTNDTLGHDGSDTDRNCWGWAGTSSTYNAQTGYASFNLSTFQTNFISDYADITGLAVQISNGSGTLASNTNAAPFTPAVETSSGHERAMAFCASKAVKISSTGTCYGNRVFADVEVMRTNDSGTFVLADHIYIEQFGEGARFRSNHTNSTGGGARKYRVSAEWRTADGEDSVAALECQDQIAVVWRSRFNPPLGS
ncbi:hypothetical protein [Chondromyces apiculatus]|uniref:Lipoprotein n=1 Tax=Chondromyces apiculatus DSM 436 TaxID=1192034 RepID=A0A017SVB8_9BACT|nr:hypothetical protein [Chondromyces apiculatus]EYF00246.1 Hypothetical protein CAP_1031 [Chondromyces apiculatus DSM 436]